MHALPLCVLLLFIHFFICFSFFLLVFSFLPHVFSFSFFCFLCLWPLSKTRIWKLLRFLSFHFFVSFSSTKIHVFACLPFSLFFFEKKFPFLISRVFWTLTLFCSLSSISVFPLFLFFFFFSQDSHQFDYSFSVFSLFTFSFFIKKHVKNN